MYQIKKDGEPEWAVIPFKAYQKLTEDAEMLHDIRDYDVAKQRIETGKRKGTAALLSVLAQTLNVPLDDLIYFEPAGERGTDSTSS